MKNIHLIIILLILSLGSLFLGLADISLMSLGRGDFLSQLLFFESRLPRLISLVVAGMSMSVSGLIMQQISQNKFSSPTTVGTIDSAKLGILVSLIFFRDLARPYRIFMAFGFALLGSILFMKILDLIKVRASLLLPLIGISLGRIIDSMASFLAYRYDLVQNINSWLQGDFSMVTRGSYKILYLSLPALILSYIYARRFTLLAMGREFSINLGLNYRSTVRLGLGLVSFMTALVVVTVGKLPFLGLIVPNLVSIFRGDNMEEEILTIGLIGSIMVLISDILARLIIYPYELSIGLIMGIMGSLIFLYLIFKEGAR